MKPEEKAEIIIWDWLKTKSMNIKEIYFNRINKLKWKTFQTSGLNKKPDFIILIDRWYGNEYICVEVKPSTSSKNIHKGKKILDYYKNYLLKKTKYFIDNKEIKVSHFVIVSDMCLSGKLFLDDDTIISNEQSSDLWRKTNAKYGLEPKKEFLRTSDYVRSLWYDFQRIREEFDLKEGGNSVGIILNDIDSKKPHLMVMNYNSHLTKPKWGARYWRL